MFTTNSDILNIYMRDINKIPVLSSEEEFRTATLSKNGNIKAREKLITANLRFVVSVACNYQNQGMKIEDLINVGNFGLIKAASKFEPNKNFKFISYAVWWIRQAILQELANNSRIVRYPLNRVSAIHNIGKTKEQLKQQYCREPSKEEIASELNMSLNDVELAMSASLTTICFDKPLDTGMSFLDIYHDSEEESIDQDILNNSSNAYIEKKLSILNEREQIIIKMYFGFNYDNPHTLEEIGKRLNITRERVRQLKDKAINTLRQRSNIENDLQRC